MMMFAAAPKYSLPEVERRWLVSPSALPDLDSLVCREIEDLYISPGRLRLRRIVAPDGSVVRKLCKKYGLSTGLAEPVTNLYLSEEEYQIVAALPGAWVRKRRYAYSGGSLDVYAKIEGAIFEVEFSSELCALAYTPPPFVDTEVTNDARYTGRLHGGHAV